MIETSYFALLQCKTDDIVLDLYVFFRQKYREIAYHFYILYFLKGNQVPPGLPNARNKRTFEKTSLCHAKMHICSMQVSQIQRMIQRFHMLPPFLFLLPPLSLFLSTFPSLSFSLSIFLIPSPPPLSLSLSLSPLLSIFKGSKREREKGDRKRHRERERERERGGGGRTR